MFNLKAGNHEVILTSERYATKAGAENGIASVKENAALDERYQRKMSKDNAPYFVLVAANGQTIGRSEMYSSTRQWKAALPRSRRMPRELPRKCWKGNESALKLITGT